MFKVAEFFLIFGFSGLLCGSLARWRYGDGLGAWAYKLFRWQQIFGTILIIIGLILLVVASI